jgi:hypothetical protein
MWVSSNQTRLVCTEASVPALKAIAKSRRRMLLVQLPQRAKSRLEKINAEPVIYLFTKILSSTLKISKIDEQTKRIYDSPCGTTYPLLTYTPQLTLLYLNLKVQNVIKMPSEQRLMNIAL